LIYPVAVIAVIALFAFGVSQIRKGGIMQFIKVIYALTIMAFLIMIVAFGISALYEGPKYIGYNDWQAYAADQRDYARNVFFISYPVGVLFVILGLILRPRLDVVRPGLLLGGLGTMIYAIAQDELSYKVRFAGVFIGLVILLIIGYRMLLERTIAKDNVNAIT
jgi:energy-coupling factor transporter transmembrane protein EcfT